MKVLFRCLIVLLLLWNTALRAQEAPAQPPAVDTASSSSQTVTPPQLPNAPKPVYQPRANDGYGIMYLGAFCGMGATSSSISLKPTIGCGAGVTLLPYVFVEFGLIGPQAHRSNASAYMSYDFRTPIGPLIHGYLPMGLVGYSRFFETGHALDYGLALALPTSKKRTGRFQFMTVELRDYWTFANPNQHNVVLRLGITSGEIWD